MRQHRATDEEALHGVSAIEAAFDHCITCPRGWREWHEAPPARREMCAFEGGQHRRLPTLIMPTITVEFVIALNGPHPPAIGVGDLP